MQLISRFYMCIREVVHVEVIHLDAFIAIAWGKAASNETLVASSGLINKIFSLNQETLSTCRGRLSCALVYNVYKESFRHETNFLT